MSSIYIYGVYGAQLIAAETGEANDETGFDHRKTTRPDLFSRDLFGEVTAAPSSLPTEIAFERRFGVRETKAGNRKPTVSVAFAGFEFILPAKSKAPIWLDVSYPTFLVSTTRPNPADRLIITMFMAGRCRISTEQWQCPSC